MLNLSLIDFPLLAFWLIGGVILATTGVWLARHRLPRAAIMIYLGGLTIMAASIFYLKPALIRADLGSDVDILKDRILGLKEDLAQERIARLQERRNLSKSLSELQSSNKGLEEAKDRSATQLRVEELAQRFTKFKLFGVRRALSKLQKTYDELKISYEQLLITHNLTLKDLEKARATSADYEAKLQSTSEERDAAVHKNEQLMKSSDPCPGEAPSSSKESTAELINWLNAGVSQATYEVIPQNGTLVAGRQGHYYKITIKKPNGTHFVFPSGKFTLTTDDQALFKSSLSELANTIRVKGQGTQNLELFVRGIADRGGKVASIPFDSEGVRSFEFLPRASLASDQFLGTPQTEQLGATYQNDDLPNLRAAFSRQLIGTAFSPVPPMILEGFVSPNLSESDRTVELFLRIPNE